MSPETRGLHVLFASNRTAAAQLDSATAGTDLSVVRVWSAATALGLDTARASRLVRVGALLDRIDAAGRRGSPDDSSRAIARLRAEAHLHAKEGRSRETLHNEPMPVGITRWPPARPANYFLARVPAAQLMEAINVLETNSNPVSNPGLAAPADGLFATWFKALDQLGSRTLTMAEMNSVIQSDVAWEKGAEEFRSATTFQPTLTWGKGLDDVHELHKFAGGFRGNVGISGRAGVFYAGRGGEAGAFARLTTSGNRFGVSHLAGIKDIFGGDLQARRTAGIAAFGFAGHWAAKEAELTSASTAVVRRLIDEDFSSGYFADPREQAKLAGVVTALSTSQPGSAERAAASKALIDNFRQRDSQLEKATVSGITAEIQMLQVLHRYLKLDQPASRVDVKDPNAKIDLVAVYQLYRTMLSAGELTGRATIEGWLIEWGVPYEP